ncbi:DUF4407 domain-containing protein [Muribaculum intestinale]|uniref:DUF4407 domain-containing protein n=1 Tax=Muribaculum intestinale TaxID=1796646 RepID=UPI0025B667E5|nr:DUF4407 domain-containing protein [Muribaculum intestinale]
MKDIWTKFSCHFVGWDYNLLKECSMGSRKTLQRYVGAIILLMLLWFYIGHGMAARYFKMGSQWSQIGVAIVFSFIIWIIERQIILIVGKNKVIGTIRIALAIIMALLGATIIDQTLFGKDIDAQMAKVIEQRTDEIFNYQSRIIDNELTQNRQELDSLEIQVAALSEAINNKPKIQTWLQTPVGVDSLGKPIYAYKQDNIPNPKMEVRERAYARMNEIRQNMASINNKYQTLRDEVRAKTESNIGLLTELEITFSKDVIFSGWASGVFYFAVFLFFLLIETLVVTGKIYSAPCDYEVLVEHQQEKKRKQICSLLSDESVNEQENI